MVCRQLMPRHSWQPSGGAAGWAPEGALQILFLSARNQKRRFIVRLKQYLLPFLLSSWLFGCDHLFDNGVKAPKCKLWGDRGGTLNLQIYRDITGKDKCIITNNFGEMLSIKARKAFLLHAIPMSKNLYCMKLTQFEMLFSIKNKKRKLWAPTYQKDMGWAPDLG